MCLSSVYLQLCYSPICLRYVQVDDKSAQTELVCDRIHTLLVFNLPQVYNKLSSDKTTKSWELDEAVWK